MKKLTFLLFVYFISLAAAPAFSFSPCEEKSLFSPLSNHKINRCEIKEFDEVSFRYMDENDNVQTSTKSGEVTTIVYSWLGEFGNRPSQAQIYKNYENAVLQAGGEVLYNYATINLRLKKGGDTFYIQVSTDMSGSYEVITLREAALDQEVFLTAENIGKLMKEDGQVNFYGIYFDTDKSEVKPESETILQEIANYLKENPSKTVFFVGHTDLTGDLNHNQALSELRAIAVVKMLAEKYGIPDTRMKAFGVGPLSPLSNNSTEEGKSKNRRVVMISSNYGSE